MGKLYFKIYRPRQELQQEKKFAAARVPIDFATLKSFFDKLRS